MSKTKILFNGIIKENPTFVLLLGMCPTLGTTTSAIGGLGMGLSTLFVLICSNVAISMVKNFIPDKVRIPAFIVIIATFVTILQLCMQAYLPDLYETLGLFIPLIVVNCILLGRAEAFAAKHNPVDSFFDGLGIGLGFTFALRAAVTFVMTIATIVTYLLQTYLLMPMKLDYMQTIVFILVIAALVQLLEIIIKKIAPSLYQALGVFLPLITTNCTILGVALIVIQKNLSLLEATVYAISTAIGFTLALVIFAGMREQMSLSHIPKAMQGTPIALIAAGLLAMAFMGFSGIKIG